MQVFCPQVPDLLVEVQVGRNSVDPDCLNKPEIKVEGCGHDRGGGDVVEGAGTDRYTLPWRGGRVVECGGLENRYVGNPGVGGSNPPLSAS